MKIQELINKREKLYISLSRDLAEFEKYFLIVSTGLLAFTITFIKDIVQLDKSICIILLFVSWGFIIFAIGIMLYTFLNSAQSSDILHNHIYKFQADNKLYDPNHTLLPAEEEKLRKENKNLYDKIKKSLNSQRKWAIAMLLCGLLFLAFFTALNILKDKKSETANKIVPQKIQIILNDSVKIDVL